jgi:hypothetical protein
MVALSNGVTRRDYGVLARARSATGDATGRAIPVSDPDAPDDDATRVLDESRQYIRDFDDVVAGSDSAKEIIAKMLAKYPDWGNPYTLKYAADTQWP